MGATVQAIAWLAQVLSPPSERQLAKFLGLGGGDTLRESALSKFYSMVGEKQAEDLRSTKEAAGAPLHYKLRSLLKLMMLEMQVCAPAFSIDLCIAPPPGGMAVARESPLPFFRRLHESNVGPQALAPGVG